MFGFSPSPSRRFPSFARRSPNVSRRLCLESLESRYCPTPFYTGALSVDLNAAEQAQQTNGPAGPYTVTMYYTQQAGQNMEITGTVTGPTSANQVVEFEGPIDGYTVTDNNGDFDFTVPASYLGNLLAGVVPPGPQGPNGPPASPGPGIVVQSNVAQDVLSDQAPVISTFCVTQVSTATYEFSGTVTGPSVQGLIVTFGGQVQQLQGQTAVVQANGTFSLTLTLTQGTQNSGVVTAQIMADNWGFSSNVASSILYPSMLTQSSQSSPSP
jgi:hypothetical protein